VVLGTSNVSAIVERLSANGVQASGPTDHGFGLVVSFRDPDGNLVEILEEYETSPEPRSATRVRSEGS
jgi:catechol-2,3-dioxygenase